MPKGCVRYKIDIVKRDTGEVVDEGVTMMYAEKKLHISVKTMRSKMSQSKTKTVQVGEYDIIQRDYFLPKKMEKRVEHERLDDIVKEFLRVCREPKLWAGIREEYLGEYAERFIGC